MEAKGHKATHHIGCTCVLKDHKVNTERPRGSLARLPPPTSPVRLSQHSLSHEPCLILRTRQARGMVMGREWDNGLIG